MEFYYLFEELLKELNDMKEIDFFKLKPVFDKLCGMYHITRISTATYGNAQLEAMGRGQVDVTYDSGKEGTLRLNKRFVTDMMNVISCKVCVEDDAEPWSEEETAKVKLLVDTFTVYVSRAKIAEAAERFAFYDDDGYHNLRYLMRYMEINGPEGKLNSMAAVHFNLKHFSLVNQQIGRSLGSFVMHSFYDGLERIIEGKGELCRVGGDNFAFFCEKERLDYALEFLNGAAIVYDVNTGDRINVLASAGVFIIPDDFSYHNTADIMDKIMSASHTARMIDNKDIIFYSDELASNRERTTRLQRIFPEALEKEEFHVFYQPKIDINTGELIGAEALCRWFHDGKIVPPMEFIPILEQGHDICKLDFYMLDHVCRDIRRWLDAGKHVVRVSVNLSRKHMMDYDLLEHIIEIVDKNRVPHKFIEIELTETTTDIEFRDLKRVVSGLQRSGISTSVDDFGMGYSSLNLIKEIPWNVLKVDKSFLPVHEDDENSTRSIMFKYVVAMAREMGLECLAEGVETQEQVDVLKNNRCDLAQGFYFDRPLPVDDFESRMVTHKYAIKS